jgi:hypothetical protein
VKTLTHRAAAALRRLRANEPATPSRRAPGRAEMVDDLARRVEYLEAALEGLQDAVYRQDVVHDRQIADLRRRHPTTADARSPGPQSS